MKYSATKHMFIFHKKDCILIVAVLILAAVSALITLAAKGRAGTLLRITIDRRVYGEYNLLENQVITIDQPAGYNQVVVKNGTAYMEAADCPDKYCMDYKPISKGGETIICLPHRVVVEVAGESDRQQLDAVVQ